MAAGDIFRKRTLGQGTGGTPRVPSAGEVLSSLGIAGAGGGLSGGALNLGDPSLSTSGLKGALGLEKQLAERDARLNPAQGLAAHFQDPTKAVAAVMEMWRTFNGAIKDQGGLPVGIKEFMQAVGVNPDIQAAFDYLLGGESALGDQGAASAGHTFQNTVGG